LTQAIIKNHIKYYQGDIPLILSAPHGGEFEPTDIENRTSGVFDMDDFTAELTVEIIKEFQNSIGKTPYAVIADISRVKVDLNRKENEAYEDINAKKVYDQFHTFIQDSEKIIDQKYGKGLYIDIHGQSHPKGYLEFGYLLVNDILKHPDDFLKTYKNTTSIKTLSKFSNDSFLEQLKGANSMGTLMCNEGYDSIPSTKIPYAVDDNYFEGAYDTIRYGSLKGGNISGIQIEFPYKDIRDSDENIKKCAKSFVKTIIKFMEIHFNIKLDSK